MAVFGDPAQRMLLLLLAGFTTSAFMVSWWRTSANFSVRNIRQEDAWVLIGGVTDQAASFRVRNGSSLTISKSPTLVDPVFSATLEDDMVVQTVDVMEGALEANTQYYYQVETTDSILSGSFRTLFPDGTRFNFTFAAGGCAWTGSRSPLFTHLLEDFTLLFFLQLGDFHYEDIGIDDFDTRMNAVTKTLSSAAQAEFYRNTPLVYIWDDHDWLGNNAGADSEKEEGAAATAKRSYRELFPHHPLYHLNNTSAAVFHAFTVGTVRFVVSDLRSESTEPSIFSDEQRDWLELEFQQALNYDFVIWVTSKPWIGLSDPGDDAWFGHPEDRAMVSDWINANKNILAISADAHMLAFDDGSNTHYGTNATSSFPILQSGPMDNIGSDKGGPFTAGCHAFARERNNQFSIVRFEFTETSSCIIIEGRRVEGSATSVLFEQTLCGPDISSPVASEPVGSCKVPTFRQSTAAILYLSAIVAVIAIAFACYLRDFYSAFLIFMGYAFTFAVGIFTPFARGVKTLDVWPTSTILLVQCVVVVFVLFMRFRKRSRPCNPEPNTE